MVPLRHELPVGGTPQGRTRHRKIPGFTHRDPAPGIPLRGGSSLSPLFSDQPRADALPGVPRPRPVYFHRSSRSRLQGGHRHTSQTRWNALDHSRLQRHHRSPLCQAQWALSGFLGTQNGTKGRMKHEPPLSWGAPALCPWQIGRSKTTFHFLI